MNPEIYTTEPSKPEMTEEQSLRSNIAYHKRELVRFALLGAAVAVKSEVVQIHNAEIRLAQLRVAELQQRAKNWFDTDLGKFF